MNIRGSPFYITDSKRSFAQTAPLMTDPQPIRVGIAGLCPEGQGLVERLSLRPDCELLLFQNEAASPNNLAKSLGITTIANWHGFLFESELAAVLFLDGRSLNRRDVQDALAADLPVGVLPPLPHEVLNWEGFRPAPPGRLRVLNPRRDLDPDFLAVRNWLLSRSLKPFTAVKRISWVADLMEPGNSPAAADDGWFSQWLWDDLDQLLDLVGELPESVFAAEFSERRGHYFLVLKFTAGVVAHLERRRSSLAPLDLGWTISGGYAGGRHYLRTNEGEIYDVPAKRPALSSQCRFDPLAVLDDTTELEHSWNHGLDVLKVQSAIFQSSDTGQVIRFAD